MPDPEPPEAAGPRLKHVVEALVFASQKPISAKEIAAAIRGAAAAAKDDPAAGALAKTSENQIVDAVDALSEEYRDLGRAFEIRESASGWQLVTSPSFSPWLRQLFPEARPARLSAPALETLAIIAYRQPVTRAGIEAVRGVAVDGVMTTLLDRGLVKIAGRADVPGRPLLYETTSHFMEHFGLRDLDELPNADELRRAAAALAAQAAPETAPAAQDARSPELPINLDEAPGPPEAPGPVATPSDAQPDASRPESPDPIPAEPASETTAKPEEMP